MKSKKTVLNMSMAFILMIGVNAVAQGQGGGRGGQGHQPPMPAVDMVLDVNGNQTISPDEIAQAAATLSELDDNENGELSLAECMGFSDQGSQQQRPTRQGDSGRQPPTPPVFSVLDSNSDEVIDEYEISVAPESLLMLDSDGDGALQFDEFTPARSGRGMRGGSPTSQ